MFLAPLLIRVINRGQQVSVICVVHDFSVICGFPVAAEYLAKGYKLSDNVLQRAIQFDSEPNTIIQLHSHHSDYPTGEKGISKRFLNYFQSLDASIGAKALGPDQTISGKLTSTIQTATLHAKTVDEQKGYTKGAGDVCEHLYLCI